MKGSVPNTSASILYVSIELMFLRAAVNSLISLAHSWPLEWILCAVLWYLLLFWHNYNNIKFQGKYQVSAEVKDKEINNLKEELKSLQVLRCLYLWVLEKCAPTLQTIPSFSILSFFCFFFLPSCCSLLLSVFLCFLLCFLFFFTCFLFLVSFLSFSFLSFSNSFFYSCFLSFCWTSPANK